MTDVKIKRYNQGFKYFGPMEQCRLGKWVKYKDYDKLQKDYLNALKKIKILHKVNNSFYKELQNTKRNCNWIAFAALIVSVVNIVEFLLRQ